jgi:hypothetical protein
VGPTWGLDLGSFGGDGGFGDDKLGGHCDAPFLLLLLLTGLCFKVGIAPCQSKTTQRFGLDPESVFDSWAPVLSVV